MKLPVVYKTAEEALSVIQSGHQVFVQGSAQTPLYLLKELAKMTPHFRDVELTFITVQGDAGNSLYGKVSLLLKLFNYKKEEVEI